MVDLLPASAIVCPFGRVINLVEAIVDVRQFLCRNTNTINSHAGSHLTDKGLAAGVCIFI